MLLRNKNKRKTRQKLKKTGLFVLVLSLFVITLFLLFTRPFFRQGQGMLFSPLGVSGKTSQQALQTALAKKNIAVASIQNLPSDTLLVTFENGTNALFSKKKDITMQISSLQLITQRLTIEGKKFSILDFRFDKPVVGY